MSDDILEQIRKTEVIPKLAKYLEDNVNVGLLKESELVRKYDPNEPNNIYGQELAKRFPSGATFLVFNTKGEFDMESTVKEVEYLKSHNNVSRPRAFYHGIPHQTYPLGKGPLQYVEANPYDGTVLSDDKVSEAGVCWGELTDETRQLLYIAFQVNQANEPNTQKFGEYQLFQYLTTGKDSPFEVAQKTFQSSYFMFEDNRNKGALASINKIAKPTNSTPAITPPAAPVVSPAVSPAVPTAK